MKHPGDKQLTAHAMGFGDGAIVAHLDTCAPCRARLDTWIGLLRTAAAWEAPAPDPALATRVWTHLQDRLEAPIPAPAALRPRLLMTWSGVAALAAMLALVTWFARPHTAAPPPATLIASTTTGVAASPLLRLAVGEHIDQAQALLLEVKHAPAVSGAVPMSAARRQARDLLAANRLYAADAAAHGDLTAAHVLGLLEPPLLEIAHSPIRLDSVQWQRMQERFAASGLLFKLRVFDQTLAARQTAPTSERNGDL